MKNVISSMCVLALLGGCAGEEAHRVSTTHHATDIYQEGFYTFSRPYLKPQPEQVEITKTDQYRMKRRAQLRRAREQEAREVAAGIITPPREPNVPARVAMERGLGAQPPPTPPEVLTQPEPVEPPARPTPPQPVAEQAGPPAPSPVATRVGGKPGYVISPFSPNAGYVDVTGLPSGSEARDPYSGKIFRVP